jgi:hypothetical protein
MSRKSFSLSSMATGIEQNLPSATAADTRKTCVQLHCAETRADASELAAIHDQVKAGGAA